MTDPGTSPSGRAPASPEPIGYASDLRRQTLAAEKRAAEKNASGDQSAKRKFQSIVADPPPSISLPMEPRGDDLPFEERHNEILRLSQEAFAMTGSWNVFYATIFAVGGVIDQMFPSKEQRRHFETTDSFAELLEMLTSIRSQDESKTDAYEPSRMITIRMPRTLHDAIKREAEELELSINNYGLTKLLQPAIRRFTPLEVGNRRGRKPGPQVVSLTRVRVPVGNSKTQTKTKFIATRAKKAVVKKPTDLTITIDVPPDSGVAERATRPKSSLKSSPKSSSAANSKKRSVPKKAATKKANRKVSRKEK